MKRIIMNLILLILIIASAVLVIYGRLNRPEKESTSYDDGIEQIDPDTIYLKNSRVKVNFSDVILSKQKETRQLIVSEQSATVTTTMTNNLIEVLNMDILKKSQVISYTGDGEFVVDLNTLTQDDVITDHDSKTVTIRIDHAHLKTIEINPEKIDIGATHEALFNRGDIRISVNEYNAIEREIRTRMEKEFNTVENGQVADTNALAMVKEVYEPIIKAIDKEYSVIVEFK